MPVTTTFHKIVMNADGRWMVVWWAVYDGFRIEAPDAADYNNQCVAVEDSGADVENCLNEATASWVLETEGGDLFQVVVRTTQDAEALAVSFEMEMFMHQINFVHAHLEAYEKSRADSNLFEPMKKTREMRRVSADFVAGLRDSDKCVRHFDISSVYQAPDALVAQWA